jgi:hypothetical protein
MEIILDTVSLQHLLRPASRRPGARQARLRLETSLDPILRTGALVLVMDSDGGLLGEWLTTCGREYVQVLITRWSTYISLVERPPNLSRNLSRKLRQLGFSDTIDKLILRLAVQTNDHYIVSDDSDFWDPLHVSAKGKVNAPVAKYIRDEFGVTVMLLGQLYKHI